MRVNTGVAAVAVVGTLLSFSAQASVIYDWTPAGNDGAVDIVGGQLAITDTAFDSGAASAHFEANHIYYPEASVFSDSPITHVSLQGVPDNRNDAIPDLKANPTMGRGDDSFANWNQYWLDADLTMAGDWLSGEMRLTTTESSFAMSAGNDGLWTVTDFNSDRLAGYCLGEAVDENICAGATGRWQRRVVETDADVDFDVEANVTSVPEPSSLGLFGLALAALGAGTIRARRAKR